MLFRIPLYRNEYFQSDVAFEQYLACRQSLLWFLSLLCSSLMLFRIPLYHDESYQSHEALEQYHTCRQSLLRFLSLLCSSLMLFRIPLYHDELCQSHEARLLHFAYPHFLWSIHTLLGKYLAHHQAYPTFHKLLQCFHAVSLYVSRLQAPLRLRLPSNNMPLQYLMNLYQKRI